MSSEPERESVTVFKATLWPCACGRCLTTMTRPSALIKASGVHYHAQAECHCTRQAADATTPQHDKEE